MSEGGGGKDACGVAVPGIFQPEGVKAGSLKKHGIRKGGAVEER